MSDVNSLAARIDAAFSAVEERAKQVHAEQVHEQQERQKRLEQLNKVFDELRDIWKPRLEVLLKKFGDRVQVTPRIIPSTREGVFDFQSSLAKVRLRVSASTDRDIRKVILTYDLEIVPVLVRVKSHDEIEFPLNAVDKEAAAKWIDDRIVDFVQAYFSMGETEIYLKDQMVEDPIAHVRFPKAAAATTLEWQGQPFYFISEETRREFTSQNAVAVK
jgi:YHS domain-containing protein